MAVDPVNWTWQVQVGGTTTQAPAASENGALAWRGEGADRRIYYSNGTEQYALPDTVRTDYAPDVVDAGHGYSTIVWTSAIDNQVYSIWGDGPMTHWSTPDLVGGPAGSKPSITGWYYLPGEGVGFHVYEVVWRGFGGDDHIYTSEAMVRDFYGPPTTWRPQSMLPPSARTDDGPSIMQPIDEGAGRTVVWRDVGRQTMSFSVYVGPDPGQWSIPATLGTGGTTGGPPDIGPDGTVVWRGVGSDKRLFYARRVNLYTWSSQHLVCSVGGASSSPSVTTNGGGVLRVVWKGVGSDPRIFQSIGTATKEGDGCLS
jgi:hypothetical protein